MGMRRRSRGKDEKERIDEESCPFKLKRIEFSNAWFQGRNLNCIQPINTHHTYHRCGSRHPFANPLFAQDFLITPSPATNLFVHEEQSREETVSHRSTILLSPFLWVEWDATSQHRGKSIERCIQLKNNHSIPLQWAARSETRIEGEGRSGTRREKERERREGEEEFLAGSSRTTCSGSSTQVYKPVPGDTVRPCCYVTRSHVIRRKRIPARRETRKRKLCPRAEHASFFEIRKCIIFNLNPLIKLFFFSPVSYFSSVVTYSKFEISWRFLFLSLEIQRCILIFSFLFPLFSNEF